MNDYPEREIILSISLKYWQDFQDTVSEFLNENLYILTPAGNRFSHPKEIPHVCETANEGQEIRNPRCVAFYKSFKQLNKPSDLICPFKQELKVYPLGPYTRTVGYLVVGPPKQRSENFNIKASNAYKVINETLIALIERNVLGLSRLSLNSIYEISKLLIATDDLEKVIDLIINSIIIIHQPDFCFVALKKGEFVEMLKWKGSITPTKTRWHITELTGLDQADVYQVLVEDGKKIIYWPLTTIATGFTGIMGIQTNQIDEEGLRYITIYANYAALAVSNTLLISKLREEATIDPLTGLANRRALERVLKTDLERARLMEYPISVIFIDMDNFKEINDRFGHLYGDFILQKTGNILKTNIRNTDIAARYGGDEFVIVLPGASKQIAEKIAQRILSLINKIELPDKTVVRASAGVVSSEETDYRRLLEEADKACYLGKKNS